MKNHIAGFISNPQRFHFFQWFIKKKYDLFIHLSNDGDLMLLNCSVDTQQNVPHML